MEFDVEQERVEAVANTLRDTGLLASSEDTGGATLCVIVERADGGQIIWGTADVTWGAAIHDADGEFVAGIETDCPSDTEDVVLIARTLQRASLDNGAIQQTEH